jgi:hypothetical protein
MIFYTLLALIPVAVAIYYFWHKRSWSYSPDPSDFVFTAFIATVVAGVLFGLVALFVHISFYRDDASTEQTVENWDLQALSTETSVEGAAHHGFFVGYSYIDGTRQISYIADHGDYSTMDSVNAEYSRIYEDEEKRPNVDKITYWTDLSWVAPWMGHEEYWVDEYYFHIPAGSIKEDISIDLNK